MYATHWFRLLALLLYAAGVVLILSKCNGVFPSAPPQTPAPKQVPGDAVPDAVAREQRDLEEKRARRAAEIARREAAHQANEAALKVLRETDLPRAFADLAREALRYHNKLADLARLEPAARWDRERPVKEARDYAYRLVLECQTVDREAQKEREAATLYQDSDVALFTEHLRSFRRGGEGIASFATLVPALAGQVPEPLLLEAIDAITMAVLPADAFDPCRNPAACPKDTPDQARAAPPASKEKPKSLRVGWWARRHELILRLDPDSRKPNAGLLSHNQLVQPTGRTSEEYVPKGVPIRWVEIEYHGAIRWALETILEKPDDQTSPIFNPRVPAPSKRSRKPDFFTGLFGN